MAGGIGQAVELMERLGQEQGAFRRRDLEREGLSGAWVDHLRGWAVRRLGPGLYAPFNADVSPLVLACVRVPKGVLCLKSAMFVHGALKQPPSEVWLAIGRTRHPPRGGDGDIRFVRVAERLHRLDVEERKVGGHPVRVFSLERTFVETIRHESLFDGDGLWSAWAAAFRQGRLAREQVEALARERHVYAPVRRFLMRHPDLRGRAAATASSSRAR